MQKIQKKTATKNTFKHFGSLFFLTFLFVFFGGGCVCVCFGWVFCFVLFCFLVSDVRASVDLVQFPKVWLELIHSHKSPGINVTFHKMFMSIFEFGKKGGEENCSCHFYRFSLSVQGKNTTI